jgi:hypothetical protein
LRALRSHYGYVEADLGPPVVLRNTSTVAFARG